MTWYKTGTVTVTNGSATIIGAGTAENVRELNCDITFINSLLPWPTEGHSAKITAPNISAGRFVLCRHVQLYEVSVEHLC